MSEQHGGPANGTPPPLRADQLNIKLKDGRGNEVFFRVKRTTPLAKVIAAYCQQQGVGEHTLRFYFDNQRIINGDTPQSLEMEDEDMIDVHQEQLGGGGVRNPVAEEKSPYLTIKVQDQLEGEMEFRLKFTTPLEKMMNAYCNAKEIHFDSVRFLFHGSRLNPEDTGEIREMMDNDIVQAFLEQAGGDGTPGPAPTTAPQSTPEPAPAQPEENKIIMIRVTDENESNELFFKLRTRTQLHQVMNIYCDESHRPKDRVRFLFDGQRIQDRDTPFTLGMKNDDVIYALPEQGGVPCERCIKYAKQVAPARAREKGRSDY